MNAFLRKLLSKALLAPFGLFTGALADIDHDELARIVSRRVARAENAVLRDYAAQHGLEGEELDAMCEEFRRRRAESQPTAEEVHRLRTAVRQAESRALREAGRAGAQLALEKLGVLERHREDVLRLAAEDIDAAAGDGEQIMTAVQAVVDRMPFVLRGAGGMGAGQSGNFPRADAADVLRQQLEDARSAGDNALAVAIISDAAKRGINLR